MTTQTAPAPSMDEVMGFAFKVVNELGAAMAAPSRLHRRQARTSGRRSRVSGPVTVDAAGDDDRAAGALPARVGGRDGGVGLPDYDAATQHVHPAAGERGRAGRRGQPRVRRRLRPDAAGPLRRHPRHHQGVPRGRRRAVLASTRTTRSWARSASSARATSTSWCSDWIPAIGIDRAADGRARRSPTSAAAAARRSARWRRRSRSRSSIGFDNHGPGIEGAKANAKKAGVAGNTTFEVRGSTELPQTGDFDLISHARRAARHGRPARLRASRSTAR